LAAGGDRIAIIAVKPCVARSTGVAIQSQYMDFLCDWMYIIAI